MKWLAYALFRLVIWSLSGLKAKSLYRISKVIKFLLLNVLKYRLKVVRTNLSRSFPQKTDSEIKALVHQYYQNLSDLLVESLASYGWPIDRFKSHFVFKNLDVLQEVIKKYPRVIGVSAHTGNFEIGAVLTQPLLNTRCYAIYRPLANPYIERFTFGRRTMQGMIIRPNKQLNELIQMMDNESILFLVADQNPSSIQKAHWVDFLNQDTAFVHGPAMLAKTHNMPVLYFDIVRIKQGYYECFISVLIPDPNNVSENEIIRQYAHKLESSIIKHPDDWLWSHKRWKWARRGTELVRI